MLHARSRFFSQASQGFFIPSYLREGAKTLLRSVMLGQQSHVESLLLENPQLSLIRADVIHPGSKKLFKDITAFQLTVWAGDKHMSDTITAFMESPDIKQQFTEFEEKEAVYGKRFDYYPLISGLHNLMNELEKWNLNDIKSYWCGYIGELQRELPIHVLNELCNPSRPLYPCPTFKEEGLFRSLKLVNGYVLFSDKPSEFGLLGRDFAILRGNHPEGAVALDMAEYPCAKFNADIMVDITALIHLVEVRAGEFDYLKQWLDLDRSVLSMNS